VSHFGDVVKKLRKEKGLTLETVAEKIGSHKGYVSGIENDKVNPPSVKIIKKYARLFRQDSRVLARLAWVDKAPEILKQDAEDFLRWCETRPQPGPRSIASPAPAPPADAPQVD
jgi:transcriptional regulator with XRE-family HTH domain